MFASNGFRVALSWQRRVLGFEMEPDHSRVSFNDIPMDVITIILEHLFDKMSESSKQKTLCSLLRVCKFFYRIASSLVYRTARLNYRNRASFLVALRQDRVRSNHDVQLLQGSADQDHTRRPEMGTLVLRLDFRQSKYPPMLSQIEPLVMYCPNLEAIMTPPGHRWEACWIKTRSGTLDWLAQCKNLKILQLSNVNEHVELSSLLEATKELQNLELLCLPWNTCNNMLTELDAGFAWPPRLHTLWLAGDIPDALLEIPLPPLLGTLGFVNCESVRESGMLAILRNFGRQLHKLILLPPVHLSRKVLNEALHLCPILTEFGGMTKLFDPAFFKCIPMDHPLEQLVLRSHSSDVPSNFCMTPQAISDAIISGHLPNLSRVEWCHDLPQDLPRAASQTLQTLLDSNAQRCSQERKTRG